MLLSIIVPFYNSHEKSRRLLATLSAINRADVELIFIDDGGTIEEHSLLKDDVKVFSIDCMLIRQKNSGPGAARNTGLKLSKGDYVWFVDSDDDINIDVIHVVDNLRTHCYDFLDFHVCKKNQSHLYIDVEYGVNENSSASQMRLARNFGRIFSKIFRRSFLVSIGFVYPENCLYEDNELLFFLPFLCSKYYVSNLVSYFHILSTSSVTRNSELNLRYFDRLFTAEFGIRKSYTMNLSADVLDCLWAKFTSIFLIITIRHLYRNKVNPSWVRYVIARYKRIALSIFNVDDYALLMQRSLNSLLRVFPDQHDREYIDFLWLYTHTLESEVHFFNKIRNSSWGSDIFRPVSVN